MKTVRSTGTVVRLVMAAICLGLLSTASAEGNEAPTAELQVTVSGFRNRKGVVLVNLFKDEDGFPSDADKAHDRRRVAVEGDSVTVTFGKVPYGRWAVGVLHDENQNRKLDKSFFGAPLEGYGASNNPGVRRGPPRFDAARFDLKQQAVELTIRMIYLK